MARKQILNLLDTHTLIWALNAPEKLSSSARRIIEKGDLVISAVSYWEMVLKKGRRNGTKGHHSRSCRLGIMR